MAVQEYETERFAPGEPPYEIRVEHADGWENVPNAESWDKNRDGDLVVEFVDVGSVTYESGRVLEVK